MLQWFKLPATQRFFKEYLQEIEEDIIQLLVTQPKRWFQHRDTAIREDVSDLLRGQIVLLEDLIKTETVLRAKMNAEVEKELSKEK